MYLMQNHCSHQDFNLYKAYTENWQHTVQSQNNYMHLGLEVLLQDGW